MYYLVVEHVHEDWDSYINKQSDYRAKKIPNRKCYLLNFFPDIQEHNFFHCV
jgi:hypothetical protein